MAGRRTDAKVKRRRWPLAPAVLDRLIEEATVDAYGDDEARVGLFTSLQDSLRTPFEVEILGVPATVEAVDLTDGGEIVAVCRRGKRIQRVAVLDLPLRRPRPEGAECVPSSTAFFRMKCRSLR